jgi:hypothetical protein
MDSHPTLYELAAAIESFTQSSRKEEPVDWSAIPWLWNSLPWSARFVKYLGASRSAWWMERYIVPIFCSEGAAHLQRLLAGDWVHSEEEAFQLCFHFFSSRASQFSPEIARLLSEPCPSFHTIKMAMQAQCAPKRFSKEWFWFRDETFAQYCSRLRSLVAHVPSIKAAGSEQVESQPEADLVTEETRKKASRVVEKLTAIRTRILDTLSSIDQTIASAFPIRCLINDDLDEIQKTKKEAFDLLLALDDELFEFPDSAVSYLSDGELQNKIAGGERALHRHQKAVDDLCIRSEQQRLQCVRNREALMERLYALTRLLDHVPVLSPTQAFREAQVQQIKSGREKIKRFRLSIAKGPGPALSLEELEHEIALSHQLALSFYEEGREVSSMKEHLRRFSDQIRQSLSSTEPVPEQHLMRLHRLLSEVTNVLDGLEWTPDRKKIFEHIEHEMEYLS